MAALGPGQLLAKPRPWVGDGGQDFENSA